MLIADFTNYGIANFTPGEVQATGARIEDVNVFLLVALQRLRIALDRPITLLPAGLTTGSHASFQHPNGTAADIVVHGAGTDITPKRVIYSAIDAGFRGIGLYWNGVVYSFHFDLGPDIRRWAWRRTQGGPWEKGELYVDMKVRP